MSDYQSTAERDWSEVWECLAALAAQDVQEPVDYVLCEEEAVDSRIEFQLSEILPGLSVRTYGVRESYALKNAGAKDVKSEFVALLDADCLPAPNWLRRSIEVLRGEPRAAAVSGRTVYPGADLQERILGLLSRSYIDPGAAGPTKFLTNNGVVFRTDVYRKHNLPEHLGAFAGRMQCEAILRDGHHLWFDPSIRIVHQFEGWPMEADIRRNLGWCTVATRLDDPRMPYAGLVRLGAAALPLVWLGKLVNIWRDTLRCRAAYDVRWAELPLALAIGFRVSLMEIPGMWLAYQGKIVEKTAYR